MCYTNCVETHCIKQMSSGNRSHCKLFAALRIHYQTQWHSGSILCENSILLRVGKETILTTEIPNTSWIVADMKSRAAKPDMLSSDPGEWTATACTCVLSQYLDILSVWIAMSLPAIFANGSSLRDLRSRDTRQLEKGKHKSLELSRGRFTVYRGAIFEIESLIRKC